MGRYGSAVYRRRPVASPQRFVPLLCPDYAVLLCTAVFERLLFRSIFSLPLSVCFAAKARKETVAAQKGNGV